MRSKRNKQLKEDITAAEYAELVQHLLDIEENELVAFMGWIRSDEFVLNVPHAAQKIVADFARAISAGEALYALFPKRLAFGVLQTITAENYRDAVYKNDIRDISWPIYELLYLTKIQWREWMFKLIRRLAQVSRQVNRDLHEAQKDYPPSKRVAPEAIRKMINCWHTSGTQYPAQYKYLRPAFGVELELAKRAANERTRLSKEALESINSVCFGLFCQRFSVALIMFHVI